jgi:hypothetical protein
MNKKRIVIFLIFLAAVVVSVSIPYFLTKRQKTSGVNSKTNLTELKKIKTIQPKLQPNPAVLNAFDTCSKKFTTGIKALNSTFKKSKKIELKKLDAIVAAKLKCDSMVLKKYYSKLPPQK